MRTINNTLYNPPVVKVVDISMSAVICTSDPASQTENTREEDLF